MDNFQTTKDLLDYIDSIDSANYAQDNTEHFKISSPEQANYYIKQYKKLEEELNAIEQSAKDCLEDYTFKVETWKEKSINPLKNKMDYYKSLLEQYAHSELDNTKKKSLKLVEGTIAFRAQQPSIDYDDNIMINFLQKNCAEECLKTTIKIDKKELRNIGNIKNGNFYYGDQFLDFVHVENKPPVFSIK